MSDGLGCLVKTIVRASPVQDPHTEQAKEDQIVDASPIHLLEPFSSLDHVGPETIIKEQVWEDVPPPLIVYNSLIIQFILLNNPVEGILGSLSNSVSIPSKGTKRETTS